MTNDKEARATRLRIARAHAGFTDATSAPERFGWVVSTYLSHENGTRGISPTVAKKYAKAYKVSVSWLITGEGLMIGPGLDAELMELPPHLSEPLIRQFMRMLDATKRRTKVGA